MGNNKHYLGVTGVIIVLAVVLYFIFDALFQTPVAASAEAGPIDTMIQAHIIAISIMFALIMGLMLYSVVVFRRKEGDEEDGPHIHSNTALEIGWTVVPTIIVLGFGFWGATVLNDLIAPKDNEMVVEVTGRQWGWSFAYPDFGERVGSPLMMVPKDQPIRLEMYSEDVLHAFWVPEFRVKQDLVPGGEPEILRFTPTEIGEYKLRCAEICGLDHANMLATVQVVPQSVFDAWIEDIKSRPDPTTLTEAERGELWASNEADGYGCVGCHSLDGSAMSGPTWQGIYEREEILEDGSIVIADDEYIRSSILNPNAQIVAGYNPGIMPQNFADRFAEREAEFEALNVDIDIIDDLIAYMKTLE